MRCKYCDKEIKSYEPGTFMSEDLETGEGFVAHESCHKEHDADYLTADELMASDNASIEGDDVE